MPTPVVELIAQELVTRIKGATGVVEVERPRRGREFEHRDHKVVVIQQEPVSQPDISIPGNPPAVAWIQPFLIHLLLKPSDADATPDDQISNTFKADVVTAITAPQATWHQFDGNAINAEFTSERPYTVEGSDFAGVSLTLEVTYRVDENDPYTAR